MLNKKEKKYIPIIAVVLGILIGCIILIISGKNPIVMFIALIKAGFGLDLAAGGKLNLRYLGEFLVTAMPIVLTGLSVAFAYRTGLFNIGAEGQVIVGGFASIATAMLLPVSGPLLLIASVLAAFVAGAIWGFIPGLLKAKFNVHEVVIGIMLNYTAMYTSNYVLRSLPGSSPTRTVAVPSSASLSSEFLSGLTNGSRFHWGIVIVIIALIAVWFIIEKTTFGYGLRATGFNKEGARYAGLKVNKNVILSMMIAGGLAGLAGSLVSLGTFGYGRVFTAFDNYGFDGIAVALVGASTAVGVFFSGLLFGLLKVAQPILQVAGIPKEIGEIIASLIVFLVALQFAIKYYYDKGRLLLKKNKKEGSEQ